MLESLALILAMYSGADSMAESIFCIFCHTRRDCSLGGWRVKRQRRLDGVYDTSSERALFSRWERDASQWAFLFRASGWSGRLMAFRHEESGFTDSLRSELLHDGSKVHLTMVQLPAMNTPQFSWCKTRLPRHPQPVPPIFQPEVAARAIVWAAHHRKREVYLGGSTVKAIVGNKVAPGLLDEYLARMGYDAQQTERPVDPDRPANLFEPVAADHTAHGIFDDKAHGSSTQFWLSRHRLGAVLAGLITTGVAVWASGRNWG